MSMKCTWDSCEKDAEAICRCTAEGVYICGDHLLRHLEQLLPGFGAEHKHQSLYLRLDSQSVEEIKQVIGAAKEKLDREYANFQRVLSELTRVLRERVEDEINKMLNMQQKYIAAFESVTAHERVRKDTDIPIFQEILANFGRFKESIKDPNWFSVTIREDEAVAAINNLIQIRILKPDLYRLTGLDGALVDIEVNQIQEENKANSDTSSYEDELEDFDPNAF